MRSRFGQWMPVLLIALLSGLIWLLNQATQLPLSVRQVPPNVPDLIVTNVQAHRFDEQGHLLTQISAARAKHLAQDDTMWFEEMRLSQNQVGMPALSVAGESAKTVHKAHEVWFYGQVKMQRAATADKPELIVNTRDLYVDTQKRIAKSSAPVTAEMGLQRARAVGFVVDERKETLELLSQVSMTYVPKKTTGHAGHRVLP